MSFSPFSPSSSFLSLGNSSDLCRQWRQKQLMAENNTKESIKKDETEIVIWEMALRNEGRIKYAKKQGEEGEEMIKSSELKWLLPASFM